MKRFILLIITVLFVLAILCLSTCFDAKHMFSKNSYHIDEYGIKIERTTDKYGSSFKIYRDSLFLGTYYWDNRVRDQQGLRTDSGTRYYIRATRDTIYLQGVGWKIKDTCSHHSELVVITWQNRPNAYYFFDYYNFRLAIESKNAYTIQTVDKCFSFTKYYFDILDSDKCITVSLMQFPEWEHQENFYPYTKVCSDVFSE